MDGLILEENDTGRKHKKLPAHHERPEPDWADLGQETREAESEGEAWLSGRGRAPKHMITGHLGFRQSWAGCRGQDLGRGKSARPQCLVSMSSSEGGGVI